MTTVFLTFFILMQLIRPKAFIYDALLTRSASFAGTGEADGCENIYNSS